MSEDPQRLPGHVVFDGPDKIMRGLCRCAYGKAHFADFANEIIVCGHEQDWQWWERFLASPSRRTATGTASNVRHE